MCYDPTYWDREYRVRSLPDMELKVNARAVDRYLAAMCKNEAIDVALGPYTGKAYVLRVAPMGGFASITLRPTGKPVTFLGRALAEAAAGVRARLERELINGTSMCRCVPIGITSTKEKTTVKKVKRFYIGKPEVIEGRDSSHWAKDTLPEAIEHAKQRAEETGEPQYVVKVIKVVRRKSQPIVVEDVK